MWSERTIINLRSTKTARTQNNNNIIYSFIFFFRKFRIYNPIQLNARGDTVNRVIRGRLYSVCSNVEKTLKTFQMFNASKIVLFPIKTPCFFPKEMTRASPCISICEWLFCVHLVFSLFSNAIRKRFAKRGVRHAFISIGILPARNNYNRNDRALKTICVS